MIAPASVLQRVFDVAESLDYEGYSKHDALNARWLERLAGDRRLLRLAFIQLVMRCPFHVRPLLGVRTARNAKGLSLFARAYLARYRMHGRADDLQSAESLLRWLIDHAADGFDGPCWGYPYPWQDVGFFAPRHYPNRVVTSFVLNAFVDAFETTGKAEYLDVVGRCIRGFLLKAPRTLFEDDRHWCLSYVPSEQIDWIVMDVSALAGAVTARYAAHAGDAPLMDEAGRLVRYVASKQTPYAAWFYAEPPGASHITHDNYHTGFILDAILAYGRAAGSDEFDETYRKGLAYYRRHLFEENGAPRFMNDRRYPYDIHGAAQGILTFGLAQRHLGTGGDMAERVLAWTIAEMFDPRSGWFSYQKRRLYTTRIRLLRWCQAWMAWALASHLETVGEG